MNRTNEILIKGWSSSRIAEYLDVSLITIQELLENGREQLKRELGEPRVLCEGRLETAVGRTRRCLPSPSAGSIANRWVLMLRRETVRRDFFCLIQKLAS